MVIVRHALQLQTPVVRAAMNKALKSKVLHDFDLCFFILIFQLVKQTINICHARYIEQDAAFGVFGFRAHVDANACAVGDVLYLGQELTELRRPCDLNGVCAGRNDEVRVFECRLREGLHVVLAVVHFKGQFAGDRQAGFTRSD